MNELEHHNFMDARKRVQNNEVVCTCQERQVVIEGTLRRMVATTSEDDCEVCGNKEKKNG